MPGWLAVTGFVVVGISLCWAQVPVAAPQPSGKLVDVGGYRVHLYCTGSGGPTVVITGAGYSFDWSLVQPEVSKFVRVCSYDHSGIAWSDPGPDDSCSLRIAEVRSALRNAGINGPYVLVGHSLGALVSRLYASKYPGEVAGMVIVDHAIRLGPMPGRALPPMPVGRPDPNAGFEKLPEDAHRMHVWANSQPGASQVMSKNGELVSACDAEVNAATRNRTPALGSMPLIAVSAPATRPLHNQLLALSSDSKLVVAERSGHYVMVDRPDVVIGAIREVVEAAQKHAGLNRE